MNQFRHTMLKSWEVFAISRRPTSAHEIKVHRPRYSMDYAIISIDGREQDVESDGSAHWGVGFHRCNRTMGKALQFRRTECLLACDAFSPNYHIWWGMWSSLFVGDFDNLLPLYRDLSGPMHSIPILWTSGDTTLGGIAGVNWSARDFPARWPVASNRTIRWFTCVCYAFVSEIGKILLWVSTPRETISNLTDNSPSASRIDGKRILPGPSIRLQISFR